MYSATASERWLEPAEPAGDLAGRPHVGGRVPPQDAAERRDLDLRCVPRSRLAARAVVGPRNAPDLAELAVVALVRAREAHEIVGQHGSDRDRLRTQVVRDVERAGAVERTVGQR